MIRTYDFYEKEYKISRTEITRISKIIEEFESGTINEFSLKTLGLNGLKYCIAESKIDTVIKLIKPITFKNGEVYTKKYVIDAISLGFVEYINSLPSSIMERYVKMYREQQEDIYANQDEELIFEESTVTVAEAAHNAVILTKDMKARIIDALLSINYEDIKDIKIKDVFARQIPETSCSIRSAQDVAFYSEAPNYLPCLYLFYKNIKTTSNDTVGCVDDRPTKKGSCDISIHYSSLSENNKKFADYLIEKGFASFGFNEEEKNSVVYISLPCLTNETIESVNKRMLKIVSKFEKQDVLYSVLDRKQVIDELKYFAVYYSTDVRKRVEYLLLGEVSNEDLAEVINLLGYEYVIDQDGVIYDSQFSLDRHREYLMENSVNMGGTIL